MPTESRLQRFVLLLIAMGVLMAPFTQVEAQPYVYQSGFGSFGHGAGQFWEISDIAIDGQDRIIIVDSGDSNWEICSLDGNCTEYGGYGTDPGQFSLPFGVDINSQGDILIADNGNGRVQRCDYAGNCELFEVTVNGAPIEFFSPWGLAVDSADNVIIVNSNSHRVVVCPPAGGECDTFGGYGFDPGMFDLPRAVAVDDQDRLIITDSSASRTQVCDQVGDCHLLGDAAGTGQYAFGNPRGVHVLDSGLIAISDLSRNLHLCTFRGACRTTLTANVNVPDPQDLEQPQGVAQDSQGRIVIGDGSSVKIFGLDVAINQGMSDAWIETGLGGQGLLIVVFEEIKVVFVAWFTYDTERPPNDVTAILGEPGHRWVTAQGGYSGDTASLGISLTQGGVFDQPQPAPGDPEGIGSMTIVWHDCMHATMTYTMNRPPLQGSMELTRIVRAKQALCQQLSGVE